MGVSLCAASMSERDFLPPSCLAAAPISHPTPSPRFSDTAAASSGPCRAEGWGKLLKEEEDMIYWRDG